MQKGSGITLDSSILYPFVCAIVSSWSSTNDLTLPVSIGFLYFGHHTIWDLILKVAEDALPIDKINRI
jgi:hypothetical protein